MRETYMVCNLPPQELILNKFRIYNIWHIQWRKPYQLSGWMKNCSYCSVVAKIQISDLPHSMTITTGKLSPHSTHEATHFNSKVQSSRVQFLWSKTSVCKDCCKNW